MAVLVEKEKHFWDALVTTLENPKNAIQYYHIFDRFSVGKWFRLRRAHLSNGIIGVGS